MKKFTIEYKTTCVLSVPDNCPDFEDLPVEAREKKIHEWIHANGLDSEALESQFGSIVSIDVEVDALELSKEKLANLKEI